MGLDSIVPKLYFDKNPDYIDYTLQLSTANNEYYPSDYKTIIVLNEPAWIIFDQKLFVLEKINGNKLKPFITKKNIQIPNKNSVEYFEKFIKKIIQKASSYQRFLKMAVLGDTPQWHSC